MSKRWAYARAVTIHEVEVTDSENIKHPYVVIIPSAVENNGDFSQGCFSKDAQDFLRKYGFEKMAFFGQYNCFAGIRTDERIKIAQDFEKVWVFSESERKKENERKAEERRHLCSTVVIMQAIKDKKLLPIQKQFLKRQQAKLAKNAKDLERIIKKQKVVA